MKKLLLLAALMTTSTMALADLVYTVELQQTTVLKKIDSYKFEKITRSTKEYQKSEKIINGKVVSKSEKESDRIDDSGKITLEVTGKNLVKLIDEKEQVSEEVEAKISRSLFGKIKAIDIEGKNMDAIYAETYKRSGLDFLKKFKLGSLASTEITTSQLSCVAESELLRCDQDQKLVITINSPF